MVFNEVTKLSKRSKQLRKDTVDLALANGGYHFGGSFSCVEILRVLYEGFLTSKDRFILSKGHACWPWYVILRELGYKPKLTGHPSRDPYNGVLCTTGSLGHGLPQGIGMAIAKKQRKEPGYVYVLMGDGELQEGTTWESALIASQQRLNNLRVIVDFNNIQGSGFIAGTSPFEYITRMFEGAEWSTCLVDGHNTTKLRGSLMEEYDVPRVIFARTVKGAGVSFLENDPKWHACWPTADEKKRMLEELS